MVQPNEAEKPYALTQMRTSRKPQTVSITSDSTRMSAVSPGPKPNLYSYQYSRMFWLPYTAVVEMKLMSVSSVMRRLWSSSRTDLAWFTNALHRCLHRSGWLFASVSGW